jgi:hypothetical protein
MQLSLAQCLAGRVTPPLFARARSPLAPLAPASARTARTAAPRAVAAMASAGDKSEFKP